MKLTKKHQILLVDDHTILREGLKSLILSQPDMAVAGEAGDGVEAFDQVKRLGPDVVVMDITMPRCNGLEATENIRKAFPTTQVIVLTVHEDSEYLRQIWAAGASAYVLKRSASETLIQAIRAVVAGKNYMDPEMSGALLGSIAHWSGLPAKSRLSIREIEVLRRLAWGKTNKEIAQDLALSHKTVQTYRTRLMKKLELKTREGLVRYASRRGWLQEG